jgi:hypothetical protein
VEVVALPETLHTKLMDCPAEYSSCMKAVAAFPKEPPKKIVVRRCVKAAEEAWNRKSNTFKLKGFSRLSQY